MIFDEVEWCFEMLSIAIQHLGGRPLDPKQKVRPRLAYSKQRHDRQALASNVISIPLLLKSVLLLESKETRRKILDSALIRRVLLCHEGIGPWLTYMIRYRKGSSSEIAVDFLATLSKVSVEDYVGEYRKTLPHDEKVFQEAKLQVFEKVETLTDLIPSLLVIGEELLDRAISTPLIWFVMNRRITTPFTVGLAVTDFKLHLVTMLAFRQGALSNVEDHPPAILPIITLTSVIFFICVHHIVRKVCEGIALSRISQKVARRYMFDFW
jgi:hypothetical protein